MKVEPKPGYKFVWYYGHKLEIPEERYYVATDKSGIICAYINHPIKNHYVNCWDCDDEPFEDHIWQILGVKDYELAKCWQDTLIEYPTDYKFEEKKQ